VKCRYVTCAWAVFVRYWFTKTSGVAGEDEWCTRPGRQNARGGKTRGRRNILDLCDILCPPNFKFLSQIKENRVKDVISFKFLISARSGSCYSSSWAPKTVLRH